MQDNNFFDDNVSQQGETFADTSFFGRFFNFLNNSGQLWEEKRGIKRAANALAVSFLFLLAFSAGWKYGYFFLTDLFGVSRQNAIMVFSDPMIVAGVQIFLSAFLFTLPFIFFYRLSGFSTSELVAAGKWKKGTAFPLFLIGISFCSFANIASSYAGAIFDVIREMFGVEYTVSFGANPIGIYGFILQCVLSVLVPALVEEFACRGLLLGSLKRYGEGFAVLTSAVVFGIMHGNFEQMPFAFLVGLVLGFITVKSGTIWIAVAVHAFNNGVSVFFTYFLNNIPTTDKNVVYLFFLCVALFSGILGVALIKDREGSFYKLSNMNTVSTEAQKYRWFFLRPLVVMFIGICFYDSFLFFK